MLVETFGSAAAAEFGESVVEFCRELCDAVPSSDPRWAESEPRPLTGALTASAIISKQIEEKLSTHLQFIDFLKCSPLWDRLQVPLGQRQNYAPAQLILYEYLEKLTCAYSLKCKQAAYSYLLEPVIKLLVQKRGQAPGKLLTPQDLFYQEISKVPDIFAAAVEYEEAELAEGRVTGQEYFNLVASITDLLASAFQEVATLRRNIEPVYAPFSGALEEFTPWDSAQGGEGARNSLLCQFRLLSHRFNGLQATLGGAEGVEFKGAVFQKLSDLADLVLGSHFHQIRLLRGGSDDKRRLQSALEKDRSELLEPLVCSDQFQRATTLAEKFLDFDVLIRVCEKQDAKDRLQSYCQQFAEHNFSEYLFNWYLKEGKQAKMLTTVLVNEDSLEGFLKDHEGLRWLHQIQRERFGDASRTLLTLASQEHQLAKKKTLLSLSKLSALANGQEQLLAPINEQLNALNQEALLA